MTNTGTLTILAEIKNTKQTAFLVQRKKEKDFGLAIVRKMRKYKLLPYFYKYDTVWTDFAFMGGTVREGDSDFHDAFSDNVSKVKQYVNKMLFWNSLPNIDNLEELLFAALDDGRGRHVI